MDDRTTSGLRACATNNGALAAMLLACLAGCSEKLTTKRWMEDVKLDDGTIIQVQREVTFNESNALGGGAYNSVEQASTIHFTGNLENFPPWSVPLLAHTLYKDTSTQEWVVVAITSSCDVWHARGAPNPPYWEYRLGSHGWRQVPLSAASVGHRSNLLRRYQKDLPTGTITLSQKDALQTEEKTLEQMTKPERTFRLVLGERDEEGYGCGKSTGVPSNGDTQSR
jgi:hypothetical protein